MTLATGSKLGPYEILGPIGAGGMGEVYRARDPRLGREVAIKVLPASFSADPDRLRRFEQEARAAGVLNHPNITAVYDVGEHDGAPYVVQELLEGGTLRAQLAGEGVSTRRAIELATQIAHGLAAAHEKGIVHRDLKPENLFVTKDGRLKILDFGLAKLTQQDEGAPATDIPTAAAGTEPGVVLGTLGYMSPEQVRGKTTDSRSDIFSFGAILYEMLSGRRAFGGDSAADTMSAILKEDPPDLTSTNKNVSPGLERVVRHCLAKNPEERFHSAHDVGFALDALTGGSGPLPLEAAPEVRRSRPWAIPALVILTIAAIAAAASAFLARRAPAEPPVFRQLTFRRGLIGSARFTPDGHGVVYSASFEGRPQELYQARIGLTESQPLGIPRANDVAGITTSGEMAVLISAPPGQTLARVPLTGGTPREIAEDVGAADISRDGRFLAVSRWIGGGFRLEYPIGKSLYQTGGYLTGLRISPDESRVAFFDHPSLGDDAGTVAVVDRSGAKTVLTPAWTSTDGLAWSPSGREIWFTASERGANLVLYVVAPGEKPRRVLSVPGRLILHDVAPDGRLLVEHRSFRQALMSGLPGSRDERDLAWLDYSYVSAIASDGSFLIFGETGEGGGADGSVYLRRTDGSPAVRLGDGIPDSLSPDEKWVLALQGPDSKLMMLPVGAGEPRALPDFGIRPRTAQFFPDGKRLLLSGTRGNEPIKLFIADVESRKLSELDPGLLGAPGSLSPDGKQVFAVRTDNRAFLYPVEGGGGGGPPREVTAYTAGDWPAGWSEDGRFLYLLSAGSFPATVWKVDLASDKREKWQEIAPAEAAGAAGSFAFLISGDERSYAYNYSRSTSELYVVEGMEGK
jgi:Tol biopolymer transport system component